ncbi:hypothetical protein FEK41_22225 [Escherichia sp. E4694]|uniref:hypothetical protein n=2 Tax=unclassified Escherichia TaxID=2608889 RepID=UPI0010FDC4EB|nr:hypothetical protein [Escherichia sp. E4694]TLI90883.1 hypothetical protein FEK41_22225 [Escherichia sp. E4694]
MSEKYVQVCSTVCAMSHLETAALDGIETYSTKYQLDVAGVNVDFSRADAIADYAIHNCLNIIMRTISPDFGKAQKKEAKVIAGLLMVSSQIAKLSESAEKELAQQNYVEALRHLVSQACLSLSLLVSTNDKSGYGNYRLLCRLLDIAKNSDCRQRLLKRFQLVDAYFTMCSVDDHCVKKLGINGTLAFRSETSSHYCDDLPILVQFPVQVVDVSKEPYALSLIKKYHYPAFPESTIEGDFVVNARIAEKLEKTRQQALIRSKRYQKANDKLNEAIKILLHDITRGISGIFELNGGEGDFREIYQYIDVVKKENENRNEEYQKWQKSSLQYIEYAKKLLDNTLIIQNNIQNIFAIVAGLEALGTDYVTVMEKYLESKGLIIDGNDKIKSKFRNPAISLNGNLIEYNIECGSVISILAEAERCYSGSEKTKFICKSNDVIPVVDPSLYFEVKQIIELVTNYKNSASELIRSISSG